MVLRIFFRYSVILLISLLVVRCAQISNPSGGPKDDIPPEVLGSVPLNGSANFEGDKFTIFFDEFIELNNISQKAMISPPLEKMPDFKLKGKSLRVRFEEDLKPNTTYSVYFGDAIVDITEGNPVMNYTYIFSTGPTVDSMSIMGNVVAAFDLTPSEEVFVLLYKDNNDTIAFDSLPFAVKPYYLSKTDENGLFALNGLADEPYLMFAVRDLNGNYFYDQPGEEIAFLDSLVYPMHLNPPVIDSSIFDTLDFENPYFDSLQRVIDSIFRDSLDSYTHGLVNHTLYLFDELDTTMYLQDAETIRKNTFRFTFTRSAEKVEFHVLNYSSDTTWYLDEYSMDGDTVYWHLRELPIDTIQLLLLYQGDTLGEEFMRLDPTKRNLPGVDRRKKKEKEEKIEYLVFGSSSKGSTLRLDRLPGLFFSQPVEQTLTDSIRLVVAEDTTYNPPFVFLDSLKMRLQFSIEVIEGTRYEINVPDSSFIDWNGHYNESKSIRFNTLTPREYGVLALELKTQTAQPYILQLLSGKDKLVRETYFSGDTTITMQHLDPGEYTLKVIFDDNGNRKWDSGYYSIKLQPEKVIYFSKQLVIRGNWDLEEIWTIED